MLQKNVLNQTHNLTVVTLSFFSLAFLVGILDRIKGEGEEAELQKRFPSPSNDQLNSISMCQREKNFKVFLVELIRIWGEDGKVHQIMSMRKELENSDFTENGRNSINFD